MGNRSFNLLIPVCLTSLFLCSRNTNYSIAIDHDYIDSMPAIPLIDLSPWTDKDTTKYSQEDRQAVVAQVAQACREIGFFAVQNHAVDETCLDAAWTASRDFFDLPADIKLESKSADQKVYPYGYEQSENLTKGKEFATVTILLSHPPISRHFHWIPSGCGEQPRRFPATFQPALESYYASMEDLAALLLKIFAMALDLPPTFFQDKMDHHMSALRVLNYFAVDDDTDADTDVDSGDKAARPLILRAGAHTDYGALTILKSGGPGLQVKKDVGGSYDGKEQVEQEWVDAPDLPAAYIINLGDLMQQWTNGTLHIYIHIIRSFTHATACT
jgi:isopenicillin N synthase-like dioxygenase